MQRVWKTAIVVACIIAVTGVAFGQQLGEGPPKPEHRGHGRRPGGHEFGGQPRGPGGPFGGEMGMRRGPSQEAIIGHVLHDKELAKEIGLSDEQVTALRSGFDKLRQEQIELKAQIELAGMEQAKQMTAPEIDEAALMAAVEKTGEIRTQMAKLKVRSLLLVRKHVTPEQIKEIQKTMRERFAERMRQRHGGFGEGRGGPGQGGPERGRGNWHQRRRDGGDERRPPRPPLDDGVKETEREF